MAHENRWFSQRTKTINLHWFWGIFQFALVSHVPRWYQQFRTAPDRKIAPNSSSDSLTFDLIFRQPLPQLMLGSRADRQARHLGIYVTSVFSMGFKHTSNMGMPPIKIETRMFDQWFRSWNQDISRRLPFFGRGVKIGCKDLDICQLNIGEFNQTASSFPLATSNQATIGRWWILFKFVISYNYMIFYDK